MGDATDTSTSRDLRAAVARIEALEHEIARRTNAVNHPQAAPTRALRGSIAASLVLIAVGVWSTFAHRHAAEPVIVMPPLPQGMAMSTRPAPLARERISMPRSVSMRDPLTAAVNTSAHEHVDDLILLSQRDDGVTSLVAIDGTRLDPIWRRPIPAMAKTKPTNAAATADMKSSIILASTRTDGVPDRIVVGIGTSVMTFTLANGLPLQTWTVDAPVTDLCALPEARVVVTYDSTTKTPSILDTTAAKEGGGKAAALTTPKTPPTCARRFSMPTCEELRVDKDQACMGMGVTNASDAQAKAVLKQIDAYWENSKSIVNVGPAALENSSMSATFWSKSEKSNIWHGRLGLPEDEGKDFDFHHTIFGPTGQSFAVVYRTSDGYRLVIRDSTTGALQAKRSLGSALSSFQLESIKGTNEGLYITMNDRIFIVKGNATADVIELRALDSGEP